MSKFLLIGGKNAGGYREFYGRPVVKIPVPRPYKPMRYVGEDVTYEDAIEVEVYKLGKFHTQDSTIEFFVHESMTKNGYCDFEKLFLELLDKYYLYNKLIPFTFTGMQRLKK